MLFYIFLIVNKSQTYSLSNSLKQLTAVVFSRRYSNRRKNYIYFQQWMNPCFLLSLIWVFLDNLLTIRTITADLSLKYDVILQETLTVEQNIQTTCRRFFQDTDAKMLKAFLLPVSIKRFEEFHFKHGEINW